MAKPIPQIKSKSSVRKKGKQKGMPTTLISGFDVSTSSIAGAAIAWNATLRKWYGPEFVLVRWNSDDHYFDRITEAVKSHDLVWQLQSQLKVSVELENVFIAQEEPVPMGMIGRVGKHQSQSIKQQAEISGAFLGGLLKFGFKNIFQINNVSWRQIVAADLGITIGHAKWNDPSLAKEFHCPPKKAGKWRSAQWALGFLFESLPSGARMWNHHGIFPNEIPEWTDLIERKGQGLIPRPENSRALGVQPDDRYDALAVMEWMRRELDLSS